MQFFLRAEKRGARLGVLPGSFNPPTNAHIALAEAALPEVDEVLFVLPRLFPHKRYDGASFEDRISLLQRAASGNPAFSVAASEGGLFREIAAECREAYGPGMRLSFLCGRDAAERIVNWDYGEPGAVGRMLADFDLLVAARAGQYAAPPSLRKSIRPLPLAGNFDDLSATEVRRRIAAGEEWQDLVPEAIRERVADIYR